MAIIQQLIKNEPELLSPAREGELVDAEFRYRTPRAAYFTVPGVGAGVVYGMELANAKEIIKTLEAGTRVSAKIVSMDGEGGLIELSLAEAGRQKVWQSIKDLKDANESVMVTIAGANSGGLIAEIQGIKAFLPVSQLSNEHYPRIEGSAKDKIFEELKKFVGTEMLVKILDFNARAVKLIISEREITDQNVKELLTNYAEGDVIDGIVSGVADFGAFVKFADNPEIEGLVHISELDHRLIEHPKEVVKVNDMVKAQITEIKDGRVSLSLKSLKPDPWLRVADTYKEGQAVTGVVSRFNPFGAFIDLDGPSDQGGIQGLIHVSEFGGTEEMKKELTLGTQRQFVIESVKPQEKRLILKLKK
ncbi:MAG: 30S ribosomal protein S1 [Candidatus Liptonbacteria bacterium]|nr:30S ribosomal protein S1 [Candidatus Liptonbacteria bacterium]